MVVCLHDMARKYTLNTRRVNSQAPCVRSQWQCLIWTHKTAAILTSLIGRADACSYVHGDVVAEANCIRAWHVRMTCLPSFCSFRRQIPQPVLGLARSNALNSTLLYRRGRIGVLIRQHESDEHSACSGVDIMGSLFNYNSLVPHTGR